MAAKEATERRTARGRKRPLLAGLALSCGALLLTSCSADAVPIPKISGIQAAQTPQDVGLSLQLIVGLTVLTLAPSILIMVTSFTRTIVVLSLLRNAIGLQQMPPNQVMVGLALFLTFFVMAPVIQKVNDTAIQPYMAGQLDQQAAFNNAMSPVRDFMFKQVREKDLALFVHLAKIDQPKTPADVPTYVLIPAFIISELKTAFQMGFFIFLPFLVIDMVVASTLVSMGMIMLPPVLISLPFKLLLFIMVDGWYLVVRSLVMSFHT
ncbi:MAG: flagellar type III secretion system pore protein FliP [Chloroflexota bacterium]